MTQQSDDLEHVLNALRSLGVRAPKVNSAADYSWNPGRAIQLRFTAKGGGRTTVTGASLQSVHLIMYPDDERISDSLVHPTESYLVIAGGTVEDELGNSKASEDDGLDDDHPHKGQLRVPLRSVLYIALGQPKDGSKPS